jgi:hypothetical protein
MMVSVVFLSLIALPHAAAENYTKSITLQPTGQSSTFYCGPAAVQMALKMTSGKCRPQQEIFKAAAAKCNKAFYSCPEGLQSVLRKLSGRTTKHQFHRGTDRNAAMFDILAGIARDGRPAELLVFEGGHWVITKGFESVESPLVETEINLRFIKIIDPFMPNDPPHDDPCTGRKEGTKAGAIVKISASDWFHSRGDKKADKKNWWWKAIRPVLNKQSTGVWANKYGGIGYNKKDKGLNGTIAEAPPEPTTCDADLPCDGQPGGVISEQDAIDSALAEVDRLGLGDDPDFLFLTDETLAPRVAVLVDAELDGYYLVLWAPNEPIEDSSEEPIETPEGPLEEMRIEDVRGAVIVNAYTGDFQEIAAFFSPLDYRLPGEAADEALEDVGVSCCVENLDAVFTYSQQTRTRLLPVWKVEVDPDDPEGHDERVERFVPQIGAVVERLRSPGRGGA